VASISFEVYAFLIQLGVTRLQTTHVLQVTVHQTLECNKIRNFSSPSFTCVWMEVSGLKV